MRIVLDLQGAQSVSRYAGIGRYSLALAQAIARQAQHHEIWICLNSALGDSLTALRQTFATLLPPERIVAFDIVSPTAGIEPANAWRAQASELLREAFLAQLKPDLVYVLSLVEGWSDDSVASIGKLPADHATAATLYDLIPLLNPQAYLADAGINRWYMDKMTSLRQADVLLAISDYARGEGERALGAEAPRIVTISSAASPMFRPTLLAADALAALRDRLGIRRPYLLYNGALDPRKNIARLLEAFAALPAPLGADYELVLAGRHPVAEREALQQQAQRLGIAERLVFTGYVTDADLLALYSHCELFVFPSLHEGFGLPPLEAMSCGAPVIAANVTSLPEVIGREDALFDPHSTEAITAKIVQALSDEGFRRQLRTHGPVQAARFSWDASARAAIAAFEETVAVPRAATHWPAFVAQRSAQREQLIERLAALPHQHPVADRDLRRVSQALVDNEAVSDRWLRGAALPERITWRIEGPFDSSYSLALLNRETARALDALGHHVVLHSTEGPGDFEPSAKFLHANADLAALHQRAAEVDQSQAQVTSRNLYPPRVADMTSPLNLLHHYAWEESGLPPEWVEFFNENLQGITCLSRHVEKVLIDAGVTAPLRTSGCGVDHWERIEPRDYAVAAKSFRFLHVSSCFPRKGADVLLRAYGQAFTAADDVSLIIKTFANPHNEVQRWLAEAQADRSDFPQVLIIEADLTDGELKSLYQQCHALVAPSRAEGFGLPLAEAMLSGLPVITTGWGGQLDFCSADTAWLIDYHFARAQSHFNLFDSVWAEPDADHLARLLREVHDTPAEQRRQRAQRGRQQLLEHSQWRQVSERLVTAARDWAGRLATTAMDESEPRIGWITTWNTRCGIAAYSAHLVKGMAASVTILAPEAAASELTEGDDERVQRCWRAGNEDSLERLAATIDALGLDTLVVQFNYNFFSFHHLDRFIRAQRAAGRMVVVELHATTDQEGVADKQLRLLAEPLAACERLLVHSPHDLNRLKSLGIVDNVALFPLGLLDFTPPAQPREGASEVIAAYGFLLPHKGLPELLEATAQLRQQGRAVALHLINAEYPVPVSAELRQQLEARAHALGIADAVRLTTDYLSDAESLARLAQADVVVFPYQHTGESASAAVRHGIASGKPVAVTPLTIFNDVAPAVFELPGTSPTLLAQGLGELLDQLRVGGEAIDRQRAEAARWRDAHRYSRMGQRLVNMLRALRRQQLDILDSDSRPASPIGFAQE